MAENIDISNVKRLISAIETFIQEYNKFEKYIWDIIQVLETNPFFVVFSQHYKELSKDKKDLLYDKDCFQEIVKIFKTIK
ncbi:MAG: hypothetical protein JW860_00420, partial [Sedimentisphaerales bacterium]|nr:hypothetical protein [Sedimentisphaerales bacterium]